MEYTTDDVKLETINPRDFERLCYELLMKYGFQELIWRQGGADSGRDIQGTLDFSNHIVTQKTKWFFECKHYTGGVPPTELNSKIAWADAELPAFLVIFTSSYITQGTRLWLEQIQAHKPYRIIVIEGPDLKARIVKYPDLIEQFFSAERFEQLFTDVKKHWVQYKIVPSYEALREIAENINPQRLSLNDLGFLFVSFYRSFQAFEDRKDYYGDFSSKLLEPLYDRLIELGSRDRLLGIEPFLGDFDYLGGSGFVDEVEYGDPPNPDYLYQFHELHLNFKKDRENWAIGFYLFFDTTHREAIELFMLDDSNFTTSARVFDPYTPDVLNQLSIDLNPDTVAEILRVYPNFHQTRAEQGE